MHVQYLNFFCRPLLMKNEESDSDQNLAYEAVEDIEILEDNSQMGKDDSQMVIDDSQNKDSQSKNSGSGDQIEDEDSPDLEIVSE